MSDLDIIIVVVMFLAGYWIVSYFWPGSNRDGTGGKDRDASGAADEADDEGNRPRR